MRENMTPEGKDILDDLGFSVEEAENLKIRAELMDQLIDFIHSRELTQKEAAEKLGVQQGRISYLMNGQISKFTIDALVNMATAAGLKVTISTEKGDA